MTNLSHQNALPFLQPRNSPKLNEWPCTLRTLRTCTAQQFIYAFCQAAIGSGIRGVCQVYAHRDQQMVCIRISHDTLVQLIDGLDR